MKATPVLFGSAFLILWLLMYTEVFGPASETVRIGVLVIANTYLAAQMVINSRR
jgi:hypothetical protein